MLNLLINASTESFRTYTCLQIIYTQIMARIKVTPVPEASTYFIDATNICHWGKSMSLQALLRLLLEIKRKKQTFFCIFDANTSYYIPDNEKKIYKKLLEHTEYFYQVSGGEKSR